MQQPEAHKSGTATQGLTFDLQTAKAMQEAQRYQTVRETMLVVAGIAAAAAFSTEMRSWFVFGDWVGSHEWTSHVALETFVNWLVAVFPMFFFAFGFLGIAALFMRDRPARVLRTLFLVFAIPMLLLPVFRGESKRLIIIGVSVCIYLAFRRLTTWAINQKPSDWKTVLAEKKRLNGDPKNLQER